MGVRYATASAFRTAHETRLLTRARKSGVSSVRRRKTSMPTRLDELDANRSSTDPHSLNDNDEGSPADSKAR